VGAEGIKVSLTTNRHSGTNTKRSKIAFTVTSIALCLALLSTKLLGLPTKSLRESRYPPPGRVPGLRGGYRDLAILFRESCTQPTGKKLMGHPGEKIVQKSRNSCEANGRGCECIGIVDSKCAQSWRLNTNAQRMSLLSHLLRSALGTFVRDCYGLLRSL